MFGEFPKQEDLGLYYFTHFQPFMPEDIAKVQEPPIKKIIKRGRPRKEKNEQIKKKVPRNTSSLELKKKTGHWSIEENKKYHWFLQIYSHNYLNKHLRRTDKIFKIMQAFLETRQAEQCRSHHQKMEKKYKTFEQLLLELRIHHYGTEDHQALAEDLEKNHIRFGQLLTKERLRKQLQQKLPAHKIQESNHQMVLMHFQESKAISNMFSDRYENQFGALKQQMQ